MNSTTVTSDHHSAIFVSGEDRFEVILHRTLRLPEDGKTHGLPPSLGYFPLKRIEDYRDRVPVAWRDHGGIFFPMWQREAMWLAFRSVRRPYAVKVAAGKVNAVSGAPWSQDLTTDYHRDGSTPSPDYMVTPPQPWLDGFNTGEGTVRQFVSMPLGMGYTVEAQVTGKEDVGGIQILAMPPKPGLLIPPPKPIVKRTLSPQGMFKGGMAKGMSSHSLHAGPTGPLGATGPAGIPGVDGDDGLENYSGVITANAAYAGEEQTKGFMNMDMMRAAPIRSKAAEMGLAQGGTMTQKIYPDPHGIDTWDQEQLGRLFIHIVNSELYEQITGEKPPKSPISAQHYVNAGYPWFKLWDEEMGDVSASTILSGAKTVAAMDKQHGFTGQQDDSPVEEKTVSAGHIHPKEGIKEGSEWAK